jgi:hypothetical protein
MHSSHAAGTVDVVFDDQNLISDAGLVPVVALAEQIGLPDLVTDHVTIHGAANSAGANLAAKVMSLLAGPRRSSGACVAAGGGPYHLRHGHLVWSAASASRR